MSALKVINPATKELIAQLPRADKKQLEQALNKARQAFDQGPWPKFSLAQRKQFLLKISQGILEQARELAELETKNTGKPIKESTFMDIPSSAKTFEYFANNLERYLAQQEIVLDEGSSRLLYEPRGVVLLIVPWNYPLLIASWKMAQALACGNTVILKPSSLTPLTAIKLIEIIKNAGLPEGAAQVVNLPGKEVGPLLCADSRIDMISFTGSSATGKEIMRFAAQAPKKLIMELGGKSASIVLADCDLEATVSASLAAIFLNQGQMCTAMSRILVDKKISQKFIQQFTAQAQKIKLGNGADHQTQMGPLISAAQRQAVLDFIRRSQKEGAKLLFGGKIPDQPELASGFFLEPAIFTTDKAESILFQEEAFGPVACISEFSSEDEAIKLANHSAYGLACCIWTKDLSKAEAISEKINAGTIWVNTYGMFHNQAPYGGFKQSGFGKELGQEGLLEYARIKHLNLNQGKPLVSDWYAF